MATEQTEPIPANRIQRDRSPAFPFISLKAAIDRASMLDAKFGRKGSPMNKAGLAWGHKGDGSHAAQTISALKYFGLVEYTGPTNDRTVVLTEDARTYMRAQKTSEKVAIAQQCALRPKAIQTYWARWGADRPIDEVAQDQLILKGNFTKNAAKIFLRVYDETIAFAGLRNSDKNENAAVDGGGLNELAQEAASAQPLAASAVPQPSAPATSPAKALPPNGIGMRQEVFALTEGDVTIQWPEHLSPDSLEDFKDWLRILERKVTRSALSPRSPSRVGDEEPPLA